MDVASHQVLWLLWRRFTVRHARRAPWTSFVLLCILALGVGVFFSVRLANRAAVVGFTLFTETLAGESDLVLSSDAGRVPETILPALRHALDEMPVGIVPVVESTASLPGTGDDPDDFDARQVRVVGLDLLAIRNLLYLRGGAQGAPSVTLPEVSSGSLGEAAVFAGVRLAGALGLETGEALPIILGDTQRALRVAGVLEQAELQAEVPDDLLLMDLPALQGLLAREGWLDRVELFVADGANRDERLAAVRTALDAWLPDGLRLDSPDSRRDSAALMTAAFRMNLTVLSGLALLVGLYLILQALEAAVVRRRPEIATLLTLGVEPRTIRHAWWIESLTLGVAGSGLGLLLGFAAAQSAVRAIGRTVNALYYSTTAEAAAWHWGEAGLAFGLGVVASCVAGLLPARDAAATPPAHVLKQGTRSQGIRLLDHPLYGIALLLLGYLLVQLPPMALGEKARFPAAGFAAAICWLVGMSIVVSALFPALAEILRPAGRASPVIRYAVSQLRKPSGRHKLTVAGLVIAISMAAGMDILIHSFDGTMHRWIHQALKADLFVACKGVQNASSRNRIDESTWRALAADPDVAAVDVGHFFSVRIEGAPTFLVGARLAAGWAAERFLWVDGRPADWSLSQPGPGDAWPAFVSESFSTRFETARGDELLVPTPAGPVKAVVRGVFADYGNERGSIFMDADAVTGWYEDASAVNLAAYLRPGTSAEEVRQRWAQAYPGLVVRTNAKLRGEILRIFRQTFSITYALRVIGVVVAVAGLALAMVSLLLERQRELVTLREIGMTRAQIAGACTVEGACVALLGLTGGLTLSLLLGYVLIFVINKQSFGWTLAFAVPWGGLAVLAVWVMLAGLAAAYGAGRWGARMKGEQEE